GLAPEGTRALRPHWKSGFYRIAAGATVPIVLGFLDYGKKHIGIGPTMYLSGDRDADLEKIGAFYAPIKGRWPDKASPERFS
ncbi:MAG: glycerol acyltransferase, partial [Woeseiaceae bacterium]